jgi:hypothetical protein
MQNLSLKWIWLIICFRGYIYISIQFGLPKLERQISSFTNKDKAILICTYPLKALQLCCLYLICQYRPFQRCMKYKLLILIVFSAFKPGRCFRISVMYQNIYNWKKDGGRFEGGWICCIQYYRCTVKRSRFEGTTL